ncbi:hypothetical protein G7067_03880 [Leucobacter insecticola]|uniref:Uncharacterized protein n=1 Tax=Leucobacter insecticola TaxID=2714934 RepID=A0A6G8FHA5_9MICO|nr:hypothetical protein [Leucobacter insecticola]QIM15745.1 hypothetical protein G7067_03880 [Leucobacter insecticola]
MSAGLGLVTRRGLFRGIAGGVAAGAIPMLAGCAASDPQHLKMACGEAGGIYLQFGELLSAAVDQRALSSGAGLLPMLRQSLSRSSPMEAPRIC